MIKVQHVLCAMVFWGQIQNYMLRVNLSILIVAMVKEPLENLDQNEQMDQETCKQNRTLTKVSCLKKWKS